MRVLELAEGLRTRCALQSLSIYAYLTSSAGDLLVTRMQRALHEGAVQTAVFTEFTEAVEKEDRAKLAETRAQLAAWDHDEVRKEGTPCPYFVKKQCKTVLLSLD